MSKLLNNSNMQRIFIKNSLVSLHMLPNIDLQKRKIISINVT